MMRFGRRTLAVALALAGLAVGTTVATELAFAAPPRGPWDRPATNDEYGLLVMANMARAEPSLFPNDPDGPGPLPVDPIEPAQPPLLWNDALAAAARYHSMDMAEKGCFQHNSCNGGAWDKRIKKWYPGYEALGENIGSGSTDPEFLTRGWLHSPGHRANILSGSYVEFGGGMAIGRDGFGELPLATDDFGKRGLIAVNAYPVIPAATVLPAEPVGAATREVLLNYYDYLGRNPDSVSVVVGSSRTTLQQIAGGLTHRIYRAARTFPRDACVEVHYEVKRGADTFRWPATGTITVAPPDFTCGGSNPPGSSTPTTPTTPTTMPSGGGPQIVIESPTASTTFKPVIEIRARAIDPDGIKKIEIYVDGKHLAGRSKATITRKWNVGVKKYSSGEHRITVKAWDKKNNPAELTITFDKP